MLLDAATADRSRLASPFNVCVIGSGPAGMTLARRLAARGLKVALMEAGGLEISPESQDRYQGEIVGLPYFDLDVARLRMLGGTSGHWAGWCRALDAHDFESLPHRPYGWPIGKADLDPYQPAASEVLGLEPEREGPDLPMTQAEARLRNIQLRQSPVRFGENYRDEIAASDRITACLNANLVDLRLGDDLATVEGAVFRSRAADDSGFTVRARAYCLCLGGLESPRMLLNFTGQKPNGIGNDHDLVGRYFCEHPKYEVAEVLFARPPEFGSDHFSPTLDFMLREQVLNFTMRVLVHAPPAASRGAALRAAAVCATPFTERLAERVLGRRQVCRWGGLAEYGIRRDPGRAPVGSVIMYTEQLLDRDSRVTLADATDDFGLRRIRLDWRMAEVDRRTVQAATLALGAHFAEQDIGRLRVRDWLLAEPVALPDPPGRAWEGSYHHMCTTRMADDPREGVVDRNCRVHGTANLYVGGSSVFSAPGFATPTYTIVQLALRLGDHLADSLPGPGGIISD